MRVELKVPAIGESITEVEIGEWKKVKGDSVAKDEAVVVLESEKATVDLPAPVGGILVELTKQKGETARVGEVIGYIDADGSPPPGKPAAEVASQTPPPSAEVQPRVMPAAQRILAEQGRPPGEVRGTGPGGRVLKEDALRLPQTASEPSASSQESSPAKVEALPDSAGTGTAKSPTASAIGDRRDEIVPMSRLRKTVAERLVQAQQSAALLTTFNEIDMTAVQGLRKEFAETFQAKFGVKLGFMSFFVKAAVDALQLVPAVNAEIRGRDIVYHRYCDLGVAIGGGKGLVVPVLRNAEKMRFAEIELAIADFAKRAKESKLKPDELQGGTFTISNGGVYGSLLSTPIVNPPQSGVLGMHAIQDRPVAREGLVVIRPMMYVALTYDHRLVDGREAVTFLKRIKDIIENPVRLLLET